MPVPITVVGEGALASLHRRVLGQHAACRMLAGELPGRDGVVDVCGPPEVCADVLGVLVRQRLPMALSLPTQWSDEALDRLLQATRKRRIPAVALGSLRVFPAAAKLKEIVSSDILGALHSVRLVRRGMDLKPATDEPDARFAAWRDADLCRWLAGDTGCELDILVEHEVGDCEREVVVTAENGQIEARFAAGQTPELAVCLGGHSRPRRVPALGAAAAHLSELQLLVAARQYGRPWLLLPSLGDVVGACGGGGSAR